VENETIICPKTIGKKCPICEHREQQLQSGIDWEDAVKKPSLRNLYAVIPIGADKYEEKIHLWDISNGNFQKLLDEELEEDSDKAVFPDPEEGLVLNIRFKEKTFGKNKYQEASRINFNERDEVYDEDIMDEAPNLGEIFTVHTYKEIQAMFMGIDEEDIEENDEVVEGEEEKPIRRKKKKIKESESEDEGDEDKDVPFEEDKQIRRKRKKVAPEPEPEEEEEENTPKEPVRRKRQSSKKDDNEDECPYDHKFGTDWDDFDDCDDCKVFKACGKKNKELDG